MENEELLIGNPLLSTLSRAQHRVFLYPGEGRHYTEAFPGSTEEFRGGAKVPLQVMHG
jgi:hypothetical protein